MAEDNLQAPLIEAEPKSRRLSGRLGPILVVVALVLLEGAAIFWLARAISGNPTPALGAMPGTSVDRDGKGTGNSEELVEIDLSECRPSNRMSGKFVTFHIRVSGLVNVKSRERAEQLVRAKQARIDDAVNIVIRGAEPSELNEPGLETIRRRLKHEFGRVFGDDEVVQQVLIPQLLQSGPGL
jgi:hypothetical protein